MKHEQVFFPCYGRCDFNNLKEAVAYVQQMPGGLSVYIDKIVMYNIRFRDRLRAEGIHGVIKMLVDEAPAIALDTTALHELKRKWSKRMKKYISDYDVQCLPKNSWILIEDCWFNGLADIDAQVEMYNDQQCYLGNKYVHFSDKGNPAGLHIGQFSESYPKFDSYDDTENRRYNNYVFSKQPLTEEKMEQYINSIDRKADFCMVHEDISEAFLPVLYYNGNSDYVLLATQKTSAGLDYFII